MTSAEYMYMDNLVKEYLLFRGFTSTLRTLETELKNDKDKGLRAERVVEQFSTYITTFDLSNLRDYWCYLHTRIFSQLEKDYSTAVRKLEVGLLKLYLVNAIQNNKPDKVTEFFEKMTMELQGQPEWKDWFALPFISNPAENRDFSLYFSKQWQDKLLLCLHNFLSVIFQAMPVPNLLSFQQLSDKMDHLQEENGLYKNQVKSLHEERFKAKQRDSTQSSTTEQPKAQVSVPQHSSILIDDFSALEDKSPAKEKNKPQHDTTQKPSKIKSFIGNIRPGSPGSLRKRFQSQSSKDESLTGNVTKAKSKDMKDATSNQTTGPKLIMANQAPASSQSTHSAKLSVGSQNEATKVVLRRDLQAGLLEKSRQELFEGTKQAPKDKSYNTTNTSNRRRSGSQYVEDKNGTNYPSALSRQTSVPFNQSNRLSLPDGLASNQDPSPDSTKHIEIGNNFNDGDSENTARREQMASNKKNSYHELQRLASNPKMHRQASASSDVLSMNEQTTDNPSFLLLSQEEYSEHQSGIVHCKFSQTGHVIASSDIDGVVKIWVLKPSPVTIATVISKSGCLSLEWASNKDKWLLIGTRSGSVKVFDVHEKKTAFDLDVDNTYQRITSLSCCLYTSQFVCSCTGLSRDPHCIPTHGRITVWDMKTMKNVKQLLPTPSIATQCTHFNHNGSMLLTGAVDGSIKLYDMRRPECISSWQAHTSGVMSVQFSQDENTCFSLGMDNKLVQWSFRKTGHIENEFELHPGASGPFITSGYGGYEQKQSAQGKLFAFDNEGEHFLSCAPMGGLIYKINKTTGSFTKDMLLGGHATPVVNVDWSSELDCRTCITGAMDGCVRISTLLKR